MEKIQIQGIEPSNKVFFEIGTGRVPLAPLAFWLMGAKKIITVDLNPYVKKDLFKEAISYIINHYNDISILFDNQWDEERYNKLKHFHDKGNYNIDDIYKLTNIEYIAPCDASETNLDNDSVDFITSYTVFEHIPAQKLKKIIKEGNRIIKRSGLFIHKIDYKDHFSTIDRTISPINFLKYSDSRWSRFADNKYMYVNRLRHDDYLDIFLEANHDIIYDSPYLSDKVEEILDNKLIDIDARFRNKSKKTLSILNSWIVSKHMR